MSENTNFNPLQKASKVAIARLMKGSIDKACLNSGVKKRLVTSGLARFVLRSAHPDSVSGGYAEPIIAVELNPDGRLVGESVLEEVRKKEWCHPNLLPAMPKQPAPYRAIKFCDGRWYVTDSSSVSHFHGEQVCYDPNYLYEEKPVFLTKEEFEEQVSTHGSIEWQ